LFHEQYSFGDAQLRRKLGLRTDIELARRAALFVSNEVVGNAAPTGETKPRGSRDG